VAFGPSAVIVQPLTFDHAAVVKAINQLSLGGGTSLASGILTSLDAIAGKTLVINKAALAQDNSAEVNIGYFGGSTIVLFSDGEDTSQTNPVTMARLASVAGVRVQTIGVGTAAGTTVQINGFSVATALDSQTLESVASVTNGSYHQDNDQAALKAISRTINLHFTVATEYTEVTALFAAAAALLLVAGALISLIRSGRVV
jgi:Ca-activated chloride channel family protein